MSTSPDPQTKPPKKRKPNALVMGAVAVVAVAGAAAVFFFRPDDSSFSEGTTFTVRRGPLNITVLQGGTVESLASQEIRSNVRGREGTKILSIVDEGYMVTQEDVKNAKILVELDSSTLEDEKVRQEIEFQGTESSYIEAQQAYEIQINQNESDIRAAELAVKFARMDFEKYLGGGPVQDILDRLELHYDPATSTDMDDLSLTVEPVTGEGALDEPALDPSNITMDDELQKAIREAMMQAFASQGGFPEGGGFPRGGGGGSGQWSADGRGGRGGRGMPRELNQEMIDRMKDMGVDIYEIAQRLGKIKSDPASVEKSDNGNSLIDEDALRAEFESTFERDRPEIDFSQYADLNVLEDGQAKQELRALEDNLAVSSEEFILAQDQFDGTKRLAEQKFVTQTELDAEAMKVKKFKIKVESAETERELFIKYTFPKQAEQYLSDYEEALMALVRTKKEAFARLSQARARLRSAEERYLIEKHRLEDDIQQIKECTIRAERPGLVVYGSSRDNGPFRGGSQEPIQEGATVRERQTIIVIPDLSNMAVNVKVHESAVERVMTGQEADIIVDARPQEALKGVVTRVAPLPDAGDRWMNPDLNVYSTKVKIVDPPQWLRPGMSAEVEILARRIEDILYVPIQAVRPEGEERVCYVAGPTGVERRIVETGDFNAEFVEVKSGLEENENVYLLPPEGWGETVAPSA